MTGEDYENWDTNDYAYSWVASKLNLVITGEYVKPDPIMPASPAPPTAPLPATPGTACKEYLNNTSSPIEGVSYVDCGGGSVVNKTVDPGQSICAQEGTLIGGGFLTELGNC